MKNYSINVKHSKTAFDTDLIYLLDESGVIKF